LILCYMQSRHAPEEPQQLASEKFSAFNLYLTIALAEVSSSIII